MKADDLVITEILDWNFFYRCPSCGGECDAVEISEGIYGEPDICPCCGSDIRSYRAKEQQELIIHIEENPRCQLHYSVLEANACGVSKHPQEQMEALGYRLIDSVPQPIADCWWFTVDKFIEPLPPYLMKMRYEVGDC